MKLLPSVVALVAGCALVLGNAPVAAQQSDVNHEGFWNTDHVARAVLTTGVENREPLNDLGRTFVIPAGESVTQVSLFTHLVDHANNDISHLWFYGNQLEADVPLRVGSDYWRTYSTKRIGADQTGPWRVLVVDSEQEMLLEFNFTVSRDE